MEVMIAPPPTVEAAIDDLVSRFLNLPPGEECTVERVFFQIQQAHWFYVDEWADPEGWDDETRSNTEVEDNSGAPAHENSLRFKNSRAVLPYLRFDAFSRRTFAASPMLRDFCGQHVEFKASFKAYMNTIPRFGCVLINAAMDHVLLVQGYGSKTYGWPRGKVNQGEAGIDCAGREAYEETGWNPRSLLRETDFLEVQDADGVPNRLYIAVGVPDDGSVNFAPLLAKEVGDIAWVALASVDARERHGMALAPGGGERQVKLWGIGGFLNRLRSWIQARRAGVGKSASTAGASTAANRAARDAKKTAALAAALAADSVASSARETTRENAAALLLYKHQRQPAPSSARAARIAAQGGGDSSSTSAPVTPRAPVTPKPLAALAAPLGKGGWSVQDMFTANSQILGRNFSYNGDPHDFGVYEDDGGDATARSGVRPTTRPMVSAGASASASASENTNARPPPQPLVLTLTPTRTPPVELMAMPMPMATRRCPPVFLFEINAIMAAFGA